MRFGIDKATLHRRLHMTSKTLTQFDDELRKRLATMAKRGPSTAKLAFQQSAGAIQELRRSRMTWAQIGGVFERAGLPVKPATLGNYAREFFNPVNAIPEAPCAPPAVLPNPLRLPPSVDLSKEGIVAALLPTLDLARSGGFNWVDLAQRLTDSGFSINPATLRLYAKRARATHSGVPAGRCVDE